MTERNDSGQFVKSEAAPVAAPEPVVNTINEPVAVAEESAPAIVNAVPYSRFKQVNDAKNAQSEQNDLLRAKISMLEQGGQDAYPVNNVQQQNDSGFNTVDDLVSHVDNMVSDRLNQAYADKVAPLNDYVQGQAINSSVENYFSTAPDKAVLRDQMDAYTATMTPDEQTFLKGQLLQGNTKWLDNIYAIVATEQNEAVQQMSNDSVQQQVNMATSPQPYKVVRAGEASQTDKIAQAKQSGNRQDWTEVFRGMIPGK